MPVFLFTDIEGSTRLWEEHTGEMGSAIARHDAILQQCVSASGGRITKHTGDGITAAFEGGEPVVCALQTQLRFAEESWGAIGELRIRVGLHAGAAEWIAAAGQIAGTGSQAGDYHGPPVNATARVMSAAWGGQILFTPQVTGSASLPPGATQLDLGQHLLKDVSAPQQIYQLMHPDLPQVQYPPPRSLSGYAISQAVGREDQRLAGLDPEGMAVSLVSATLLPTLLGDRGPGSRALADNLGVLRDLGAGALAAFLAGVAGQLPPAEPENLRRRLEAALRARWQADLALRTDASRLLQAVHGVDAAMAAATSELKEALAQGLASLGSQFGEFRWMLADVGETLAEVHSRQEVQLTLQREQLARTDEILELLRTQPGLSPPLPRPEAAPVPAFLESEEEPYQPPIFVARERELERLEGFLDAALAGHGQVAFVTGGPGRGKTVLLAEFARRAMEAQPDLLVATGNCAAIPGAAIPGAAMPGAASGLGDPYLPFREVLDMLTGGVEGRWASGLIASGHARRLWSALPLVAQAVVDHGPHVAPALVSGQRLLSRALAAAPEGAHWLQSLEGQVARQAAAAGGVEQAHLFQQVTNVLRALAQAQPLLLILDDLHWVDNASIGLLFHLGRRLEGARILIVGTYRPVEVALGRDGERHPLGKLLGEFKRTYGDVWLDLAEGDEGEGRRFVDALLETEPNALGEEFRAALAEHTGGHPLFTAELLEAMQQRGDLVQDEAGRWTQAPVLDWQTLPARVEGVIEEQVGRLDPELRDILSVASVEGETFTVPVVAQVEGIKERQLIRWLAGELERRHGLVLEQAEVQVGPRRLSRFRFSHALIQNYFYQQLSRAERRMLHADFADALESCYGEGAGEFALQLAQHYHQAGDEGHAFSWFSRAAENARRVYANDEARTHYTSAIELAERVAPDAASLARLHHGRGLACETLGDFDQARADHEAILQIADAADERRVEWRALLDLGKLWASRDYSRARGYFEQALELARGIDDPAALADSLNWMGNWHANAEDSRTAIDYHQQALEIVEELGDQRDLANTLDLLGLAHLLGGDPQTSIGYYDRAIALCRELDDRPRLVTGLIARGVAHCAPYTLTVVPATVPTDASRDLEEASRIAREIGSASDETWVQWALGQMHTVHGRFGPALEALRAGLRIASRIEHREYEVANRTYLGVLHVELLAPGQARLQLREALSLAEELRSTLWILNATGALAAALCLLDDLAGAQACLESVLSAEMPMEGLAQRCCWARRAELALCQGNPELTLDIVERLIASAPGMAPGRVITFLWKLKGEALGAMGETEEAQTLLREAIENARATGERSLLWRLHASLGRMYRSLGRHSDAEVELSKASELVEELAATLPGGELRDNFLRRAYRMVDEAKIS
jgi:class 3 adenylate cyclase/tetratricopeptide (TPR) repeat protein